MPKSVIAVTLPERFEILGMKKLASMLAPSGLRRRVTMKVMGAMKKSVTLAEKSIRKSIQSGQYTLPAIADPSFIVPNSKATIGIKNSKRVLRESGDLSRAIRSQVVRWDYGEVGTSGAYTYRKPYRQGRWASMSMHGLVEVMHNGKTIAVTDRMRRFFSYMKSLSDAGQVPGTWEPLSVNTTHIVIPPRPFLWQGMSDENVKQMCEFMSLAVIHAIFSPEYLK